MLELGTVVTRVEVDRWREKGEVGRDPHDHPIFLVRHGLDGGSRGLGDRVARHDLAAFIIPGNDPHNSEYAPPRWEGRAWISGFTGSAGTIVISENESGLWTDSRYFLQAEDQLSTSEMVLHKMYNQFTPSYINWLVDNVEDGSKVGMAGEVLTKSQYNMFKKLLDKKGIELVIQKDLLDEVWTSRPDIPDNLIFEHNLEFAGVSREEKLEELRKIMSEKDKKPLNPLGKPGSDKFIAIKSQTS